MTGPDRTGAGTAGTRGAGTRARAAAGACEGHECRTRASYGHPAGRTTPGYRLCAECHRGLVLGVRQLPGLYRDCERVLGAAAAKGLRERTSGGPLPGAPFNAAAAEARAAIMGVLGAWSGLVAQERRVTPPRRSIGTLSVFLLRHTDWLATHPAAAEATREVARLVSRAHRVAHPDPVRRIALGACVEPGCAGRLFATVRVGAPGTHPSVRCDADPLHSWAGHQWTHLRRLMPRAEPANRPAPAAPAAGAPPTAPAGPADRWLTAADISRLWHTPVGTVYRLASEQRWRRHHRSGRTYYSEADAHECFSRRAERSRQG
jgi:hypothetical protein